MLNGKKRYGQTILKPMYIKTPPKRVKHFHDERKNLVREKSFSQNNLKIKFVTCCFAPKVRSGSTWKKAG